MRYPRGETPLGASPHVLLNGSVLLQAGTVFEGKVAFSGNAVIEGRLDGNVCGRGALVVGKDGYLLGHVMVDELVIYGMVEGDVHARVRVEMCTGSCVTGFVEAPVLSVAEGARLKGPCRILASEGV